MLMSRLAESHSDLTVKGATCKIQLVFQFGTFKQWTQHNHQHNGKKYQNVYVSYCRDTSISMLTNLARLFSPHVPQEVMVSHWPLSHSLFDADLLHLCYASSLVWLRDSKWMLLPSNAIVYKVLLVEHVQSSYSSLKLHGYPSRQLAITWNHTLVQCYGAIALFIVKQMCHREGSSLRRYCAMYV